MAKKGKASSKARLRASAKYRSRKSAVKKSAPSKTLTKVPRGLAEKMNITIVYSDLADTLVGTAPTYYQSARFAMTNLVDPDITGSGFQPPLFDNLKLLYGRWIVNSAKVTVHAENYTNSPCMLTLVGLFEAGNNNPTSPANPSTYDLMALDSKNRSARKRINTVQVGNGNSCTLSKTFYPKDFVSEYYTSVNYIGNGNSAPNNYPVIDLIAQSCNPAVSSEIGIWFSWSIEYNVTFSEKIETEIAAYD